MRREGQRLGRPLTAASHAEIARRLGIGEPSVQGSSSRRPGNRIIDAPGGAVCAQPLRGVSMAETWPVLASNRSFRLAGSHFVRSAASRDLPAGVLASAKYTVRE